MISVALFVVGSSFTWGYTVEAWSWEALRWRVRDFIRRFINFIIARIEFLALNTCDLQGKHRTLPTIPQGDWRQSSCWGWRPCLGLKFRLMRYIHNPYVLNAWKTAARRALKTQPSQPHDLTHFIVAKVLLREVMARRLIWWLSRLVPIIRKNPFVPQKAEDVFPHMIRWKKLI